MVDVTALYPWSDSSPRVALWEGSETHVVFAWAKTTPTMWGETMGQRIQSLTRLTRSGVVTGVGHLRRGWWHRFPFLPVLDATHLAWRRTTAYGIDRPADRRDVKAFLLWADRQRRAGA